MAGTRQGKSIGFGSDSFIDVLSNTVGALVLLCILAALEVGNVSWPVYASKTTSASTDPLRIVVTADRMRLMVLPSLSQSMAGGRRFLELPASNIRNYTLNISANPDGDSVRLDFVASPQYPGEAVGSFLAGHSATEATIKGYDPARYHIFLYLTNQGFDHYLALRSYFLGLGYQVGWETIEDAEQFTWFYGRGGGARDGRYENDGRVQE